MPVFSLRVTTRFELHRCMIVAQNNTRSLQCAVSMVLLVRLTDLTPRGSWFDKTIGQKCTTSSCPESVSPAQLFFIGLYVEFLVSFLLFTLNVLYQFSLPFRTFSLSLSTVLLSFLSHRVCAYARVCPACVRLAGAWCEFGV